MLPLQEGKVKRKKEKGDWDKGGNDSGNNEGSGRYYRYLNIFIIKEVKLAFFPFF